MTDPAALVQHVSLELGTVTVVTVAGVQQVTAEWFVCLLQKVDLVQHFVVVIVVLCTIRLSGCTLCRCW